MRMNETRTALEALADKMGERCGDHCSNSCPMCEARNDLLLILIHAVWPESYQCAMCKQTFDKTWSDEEALAEMQEHFGGVPADEPLDIVCDDCYKKIDPRTHPEEVEAWRRDSAERLKP